MNATLFELDTTLEGHFFPVQVTSNFQASCEELGTFTRVDFGAFHRELVGGKTYLITINSSSNSHNFYLSQETIDSTVFHAITDGTPGSAFIYYEPLINARMIKMDLEFESGYYCTAGLVESQLDNLEVYPNPSNGMLSIDYDFTKSTWIEIIDLNGRTLFMTQPYNTHSGNTFTINAGFLENGLYILRLSDNGKSISTKIQIL